MHTFDIFKRQNLSLPVHWPRDWQGPAADVYCHDVLPGCSDCASLVSRGSDSHHTWNCRQLLSLHPDIHTPESYLPGLALGREKMKMQNKDTLWSNMCLCWRRATWMKHCLTDYTNCHLSITFEVSSMLRISTVRHDVFDVKRFWSWLFCFHRNMTVRFTYLLTYYYLSSNCRHFHY